MPVGAIVMVASMRGSRSRRRPGGVRQTFATAGAWLLAVSAGKRPAFTFAIDAGHCTPGNAAIAAGPARRASLRPAPATSNLGGALRSHWDQLQSASREAARQAGGKAEVVS